MTESSSIEYYLWLPSTKLGSTLIWYFLPIYLTYDLANMVNAIPIKALEYNCLRYVVVFWLIFFGDLNL